MPDDLESIRSGIDALDDEVTVIVVTHRASTLEMCDRVFVLEGDGAVRERVAALDVPTES